MKGELGSNTVTAETLTAPLHQWTDNPDRKSVRKL